MTLQSVEFIIGTVTVIFAYFVSITVIGYAEAYVARWAGDDTPEQYGFLSGNPMAYFSFFGFLCTILFGFGWGQNIPFNPHNVDRRPKLLSVMSVYLAQPFFSLVLSFMTLILCVMVSGPESLQFVFWRILSSSVPFQKLAATYPERSSFVIVAVIFLLSLVAFNLFLATLSLITNLFQFILFVGAEHGYDYMRYADVIAFFGPLIIFLLFTGRILMSLTSLIVSLAYKFSALCGVC